MAYRILIVEDDKTMQEMLAVQLQQGGYSVVAVGSTDEALTVLATREFAVVVTDFDMPGRDGFELIKTLQSEGRDVPVIMMTGFASMATARRARESGASGFLAKPFTAEDLLEAIGLSVSA
ncbi:MAG: response regulator [bacterium]|nr:response regulator [bacterium]